MAASPVNTAGLPSEFPPLCNRTAADSCPQQSVRLFRASKRDIGAHWWSALHHVLSRHEGSVTENAARPNEAEWWELFQHNPLMYFIVDTAGIVLSVNESGAAALGY